MEADFIVLVSSQGTDRAPRNTAGLLVNEIKREMEKHLLKMRTAFVWTQDHLGLTRMLLRAWRVLAREYSFDSTR